MEEWRQIEGYEGYYEVSNDGRVRGIERNVKSSKGMHVIPSRIMSQRETEDGYRTVSLSKDGVAKKYPVHRLVYEAFCGKIPDGCEINHKDFDRANNRPENLEAVTHLQNIQYTVQAGRHFTASRDVTGQNNPNYGNRKLSQKYQSDPELSRLKQGRPGSRNGRSKPIEALYADGLTKNFLCIKDCVDNLIESGIATGTPAQVYACIYKGIKKDTAYNGVKFRTI